MKAIRLNSHGLDGLQLSEVSKPAEAAERAIIQIKAAGINPSDLGNVKGVFTQTTLPRTLGRDYAGIVASGPAGWVGVEVWGSGAELGFTTDGTHAEYVSVPVESLVRKPVQLTFAQAAAAGVPLATAWQAIVGANRVRAGETALVSGAAGAVGSMACQIARHFGARPIGIARGMKETSDGVPCADSDLPDLVGQIRALAGPGGVQLCLDTVGGDLFTAALASLAEGGRMAVIIAQGDGKIVLDLRDLYRRSLQLLGVNSLNLDTIRTAAIYREANAAVDAGHLHIAEPQPVPLSNGVETYRAIANKQKGKFVLVP